MNKVLTLTLAGLFTASLAQAVQFEVTDTIKGSLDTVTTTGFGIRLKDPKVKMVGDPQYDPNANTQQWSNGDDGNLNYRKGDAYATYLKFTPELLMQFPQRIKFMARGTLLYDFMATETARSPLSNDSRDQAARDYKVLDLWASKEFNLGEQTARVRVGNQVVSWGESVFALGGINQTNSLDLQKLMVPGTQLKEAIIPAPMISFSTGVAKGLNMEAYYQWAWDRHRVPPVGTYWSIADVYNRGKNPIFLNINNTNFGGVDNHFPNATFINAATGALTNNVTGDPLTTFDPVTGAPLTFGPHTSLLIPFMDDKKAQGQGQYGVAIHYKPEGLSLDLGLYFMNYHDKMPVLSYGAGAGAQWNFLENRQLYGVSANMPVGNWAMGWELSYRPKEAVALSACGSQLADGTIDTNPFDQTGCNGWKDTEKYQTHLTGLLMLTPGDHGWLLRLLGADSGIFLGEAVANYFPGLKKSYASGHTNFNVITQQDEPTYQVPAAGYMPWRAQTSEPNSTFDNNVVASVGTKFSSGYTIDFSWTYDGTVIPGWQVTPGVTFFHAVVGDTPTMLYNYAQGAKSTNVYLLFNMNPATWQAGINYTKFYEGGSGGGGGAGNLRQPLADRDTIGGFVSYNF